MVVLQLSLKMRGRIFQKFEVLKLRALLDCHWFSGCIAGKLIPLA